MPENLPPDLNSAASNEWMRYTLSKLNQSFDDLTHELRETKKELRLFIGEEKKELADRLHSQDQRIGELELSVAVLKDRMVRIAVIGTFVVGAIVTVVVPNVFRDTDNDSKSFIPDRATVDRSIAPAVDRSTADSTSSKVG